MPESAPISSHPHFVSLEGGEGAGKSTVLGAVSEALQADGVDVVCTREPGGTPLAEQIRALLLDSAHEAAHSETELLLMFAARVQHVREVISPALARGAFVLCDRFTDSSYAYQGAGRGLDVAQIECLERAFVGMRPGLTLLLDIDVGQGRARARRVGIPDRIESERDVFFERIRAAFRARASAEPARFRVLDAAQPAAVVAAQAVTLVQAWRSSQTES